MKTLALTNCAVGIFSTFFLASAKADTDVYMSDKPGNFGTLDLNTGVFDPIGNMGVTMTGMDEQNGTLYGGEYQTGNLYTINPITAAITLKGSSSEAYELFGGTPQGLFALGVDMNLYSVNAMTGAATLVGPTGLTLNGTWYGMSSGSSTLYFSDGPNLYALDTSTGASTLVGDMGGPQMGAMLEEGGVLYGGNDNGTPSVDTINPLTGIATAGPDVTGPVVNFWALASEAPAGSTVPDATSSFSLLGAVCLGGLLIRRRWAPATR